MEQVLDKDVTEKEKALDKETGAAEVEDNDEEEENCCIVNSFRGKKLVFLLSLQMTESKSLPQDTTTADFHTDMSRLSKISTQTCSD